MKKHTNRPRYWIGVDTGVNTGFAVWDAEGQKFIEISTMTIHNALFRVLELNIVYNGDIFLVVEDARKRKFDKGLTPEKRQGAGSVKRDAKIWEDFLSDKKIAFKMVAPSGNLNKLAANSKLWQTNTKWNNRTSEHARCAAMLVWKQ